MISVPNLLQRLNGSNLIGIGLLLVLLVSCSAPKSATKDSASNKPSSTDEDKVRVYDPASGKYVLVPRDAVRTDTIKWTEDKTDPILTDKTDDQGTPEKKNKYEISLLLPLNSLAYPQLEGQLDGKLVRFMQYYGGMKIAAEEIKQNGWPITINAFDTEISLSSLNEILKDPAVKRSDILIGPYDRENIESVANFGMLNKKMVISPFLPAFSIDNNNPYFIQTIPGLSKNAEAIMNYIGEVLNDRKIYLVARNNPNEIQRLQSFKKNKRVVTEDLIIDDASIDLAKTDLAFLLEDPQGTVFVMPYYSRNDEQFVSSFLRKLHADKGTKDVIVFGLPQWTSFNSLNPNYMESMNVHISSPTYLNTNNSSYRSFRDKFFKTYFALPDNMAYQGYDLLMWVAKRLMESGVDGLTLQTPTSFGIVSGYELEPVYPANALHPSDKKTPLYYENKKIHILKYVNQDYELARM